MFKTSLFSQVNSHQVLLIGSKSNIPFQELEVGNDFVEENKFLSVSGKGPMGRESWGEISYELSDGQKHTFVKGGVIGWTPPNVHVSKIYGTASSELVVYLLSVKADKQLNPSSSILLKKWKISAGKVEISLQK